MLVAKQIVIAIVEIMFKSTGLVEDNCSWSDGTPQHY